MNKKARLVLATSVLAATVLGTVEPVWAISGGDIKIETNNSIYNKGDDVKVEIKIKSNDGSNFLLQTDIAWSNGMTLKSVSGDNIQYNRGKIVGTAPMPEFVINVTLNVNAAEDQTINLTNVKMGAVDGSPNYTIDKSEKIIDVKEPVTETTPPTEPPVTTPPVTEPPQPSEPEKPKEPETPVYTPWKATVTVSDNLNVREGPGLNYNIIGKYDDGDHVTVTNEQKGGDIVWLKVEKGWISKDYVIEGHLEKPEKTDEEIEREQQEQINNEAENAENENQANNEAAQKKDEDKKEEYDRQEQTNQNTSTVTEEVEEPESPDVETESENVPTETPAVDAAVTPGKNPISIIEGSSYVYYHTEQMSRPFYLYLEAYSKPCPEKFEKVSQSIGGLDFLFFTPEDLSIRKQNVFVVFGSYDETVEPQLYYFDKESDSFFPYDKMLEKTVVVDKTVEYEKKTISKSHVIGGILGALGLFASGAFVSALSARKKEKEAAQPAPPKITHSAPKLISTMQRPNPEAVKNMTDEELDELLKVYGASTSDMLKRDSQMKKETQRIGNLKNVPKPVVIPKEEAKPQTEETLEKSETPTENPTIDETKGKKMTWDTLTSLMKNPEQIEETPVVLEKEETSATPEQEMLLDSSEAIEVLPEPDAESETVEQGVNKEELHEEMQQVAAAIAEFEGKNTPAEDEEPVLRIDLKFEAEPASDIEVDDLQLEFEKAVAEDKLNVEPKELSADNNDEQ